jgi:hypothetical protein
VFEKGYQYCDYEELTETRDELLESEVNYQKLLIENEILQQKYNKLYKKDVGDNMVKQDIAEVDIIQNLGKIAIVTSDNRLPETVWYYIENKSRLMNPYIGLHTFNEIIPKTRGIFIKPKITQVDYKLVNIENEKITDLTITLIQVYINKLQNINIIDENEQYLLDNGADITLWDYLPLRWAIHAGSSNLQKYLTEDLPEYIYQAMYDKYSNNLLSQAIQWNWIFGVKYAIDKIKKHELHGILKRTILPKNLDIYFKHVLPLLKKKYKM